MTDTMASEGAGETAWWSETKGKLEERERERRSVYRVITTIVNLHVIAVHTTTFLTT